MIIANLFRLLMYKSEQNENLNIQFFRIFNIEFGMSPRFLEILLNAINFSTFAQLLCDIWEVIIRFNH